MRAQFEKIPEIATSLSQHIYFGDDNLYHSDLLNFQKLVCWINGAWFAYQEQQKKIDEVKKLANDWYKSSGTALAVKVLEILN